MTAMRFKSIFAKMFLAQALFSLFLTPISWSQNARQRQPAGPTPRWPDGKVNLGPLPGEKGHWIRQGRGQLASNPNSIIAAGPGGLPTNLKLPDVPFQPWARALYEERQANNERDAPHARCKPSPGPRQIGTAYGFEIVDMPEIQRMMIFDIGGPQSYRTIYMDGRPHPAGDDLIPGYYGHSVGHWDADTLVVDTVGFNERSWIEAEGMPHTDRLHLIERFTRTDSNTLRYEVTVDDPGAYTATWSGGFFLRWNAGAEMFEYVCQDNNRNQETVVGADGAPPRTSRIVP
jgi:hypothetical protein